MKNKKDGTQKLIAFIIMVIVLVISVIIGVTGTIFRVKAYFDSKKPKVVVIHDFYEDGKLWFYVNGTSTVSGNYICNGKNIYCGWAYDTVDDDAVSKLSHPSKATSSQLSNIMNNDYAFIIDADNKPMSETDKYSNEKKYLIKISSGQRIEEYSAIKNYGIRENNFFIVKNLTKKWGVIQITNNGADIKIPFEYDFIGLYKNPDSSMNPRMTEFVVDDMGKWYIVDNNGGKLTQAIGEPIYGYEKNTIVTTTDGNVYNIYNQYGGKVNSPNNNISYSYGNIILTNQGIVVAYNKGGQCDIYNNEGRLLSQTQLSFGKTATISNDTSDKINIKDNDGKLLYTTVILSNERENKVS